jgi:glycosyltransferase involved in cell wall biosynthesis
VARSIFYYTDSRELGGAELSLLMLIEGLDRAVWEPTLLVDEDPGSAPLAERAEAEGIAVRRVEPMPLGLGGGLRAAKLARVLRRERPAIFHATLSWPLAAKWALAAAVAARVPSVATVQLIPEFRLERSSAWQLRALAAGVGRYVGVSRDVADELVSRFHYPADRVEVVYNAVRLELFEPDPDPELRAQLQVGRELPVVLTCARLDEQKGHDVLLRAAARLSGVAFVLAGEGPERGRLEALTAELGIADRVLFLGYRTDVPRLLAACDVFALPSLYEGSSLALLEAMAARRAIVSSAIGGTDELIENGVDGILVAPGEDAPLAAALGELLGNGERRAELGTRARARVESDFTPAAMRGRVLAIYEELLAGGRRG